MAISYKEVRNGRQWKASTGLSEEQFFTLAKMFSEAYEQLFGVSMIDRQNNSTNVSTFKTYEDLLFFPHIHRTLSGINVSGLIPQKRTFESEYSKKQWDGNYSFSSSIAPDKVRWICGRSLKTSLSRGKLQNGAI